MIKERLNMLLRARIFLIISISSLILYLSVEGLNILPSIAQPESKLDKVNQLQKDRGSRGLDKPKDASEPVLVPTPSPVPIPFSGPDSLSPDLAPSPSRHLPLSPGLGPVPGPSLFSGPVPYPNGLSMAPATSPFSGPIPDPNPPFSPGSGPDLAPSPFPGPSPGTVPGPSSPGFFDHDVALAIESRIKQSQTDAQLAMDQAKKLLKDPKIASSETGVCLSKCVDKYGASLNELNRAIMDLGFRDVTLLADDFGAVEIDISTCQACFTEYIGEDSPLKVLEEATTKAARECLNVMDYAA